MNNPPTNAELTLTHTEAGLRLTPSGKHPRLERAFCASPGRGMLDLLRFGLPAGASPALSWMRERAREHMMLYLRHLRRGDAPEKALILPPEKAARLLQGLPPLHGNAATTTSDITAWIADLGPAIKWLAQRESCTPEEWLCRLGEGWQQLGLLCFHLAENAGENAETAPFAFLATFVHKVSQEGKARHAPLGLAPRLLANDKNALLDLLKPLRAIAAQNTFLAELINTQAVYKPCAWNARQAYQFLETLPLLEQTGIETHIVNLWKTLPRRIEIEIRLETASPDNTKPDNAPPHAAPSVNIHSLLHFIPQVALGDRYLTEEELETLLAGEEDGLVRFRGEWVRLDRDRLQKLLNSWKQATRMAANGIPLLTGLRYLLGKRSEAAPYLPPREEGTRMALGARLALALSNLHFGQTSPLLPPETEKLLRHYQRDGIRFLLNVTEAGFGACLADDMGLGKTLQAICWLLHLAHTNALGGKHGCALIITPTSLLENWQEELRRFAPQLHITTLHPYALNAIERTHLNNNPAWLMRNAHIALTTYGMATRNEHLSKLNFPALILDEAQAIKNAGSQRAQAIARLHSPRRVALTGTPIENSLTELHSLFEFLNPGLLGNAKEFSAFIKEMGNDYTPLRRLIHPFMIRRLKSDPGILPELPTKTEQPAYCHLTPEQTRLYAHEIENLRAVATEPDPQTRLTLILPVLSRLKQICNHPAQYCGETWYDPAASGKFARLGHLARQIADAGDSCLIFTQYRTIIDPLHEFLADIFQTPGLILHGGTPIAERHRLVSTFQSPNGPPFFILSLKAAGTGLTLTRARHVIHFDRWWNPAIENQASDRAHRIGQKRPVIIHPLISRGTIEENIQRLLHRKSELAETLLSGGMEKLLLHLNAEELINLAAGTIPP